MTGFKIDYIARNKQFKYGEQLVTSLVLIKTDAVRIYSLCFALPLNEVSECPSFVRAALERHDYLLNSRNE